MSDRGTLTAHRQSPSAPSAAQVRIINAALELFARHGVGGTSLQMIADAIGVTKAAVYHQYHTKEEIVIAAAEAELARLEMVIAAAESETSRTVAVDTLLSGMIDLAVAHRRTVSTILNDPVIASYFADNEPFRQVMFRMSRILVGEDVDLEARISTAMLTAAISGTVMHPFVAGLDDETLRSQLERLARHLLPASGATRRVSRS
jgi:AcrR family transcriptional regulator